MPRKELSSPIVGLIIRKGEKQKLHKLCFAYNIPIPYPNLFENKKHYALWALSNEGIGLTGTVIMSHLDTVLHGVDELEAYLQSHVETSPNPNC